MPVVNQYLVRHRDGYSLFERTPFSPWGVRQAFLSLGQFSKEQAKEHCEGLFDVSAAAQEGYRAGVFPRGADTPLIDVHTGDTVATPAGDLRMLAVTVSEDAANGALRFAPEIAFVRKRPDQRHEASIAAMSKGTVAGAIASASPAAAPPPVGRSRGLGAGLGRYTPGIVIGHDQSGPYPVIPGLQPDYVCDGTNDADQWQAAFDYAGRVSAPGDSNNPPPIFVVPGVYSFSHTVTCTTEHQRIIGLGTHTSVNGGVEIHPHSGLSGPLLQLYFENFIEGVNFVDYDAADGSIQLKLGDFNRVERCSFSETTTPPGVTHYAMRFLTGWVGDCVCGIPIDLQAGTLESEIRDCYLAGGIKSSLAGGGTVGILANCETAGVLLRAARSLVTGCRFTGQLHIVPGTGGAGSPFVTGSMFVGGGVAVQNDAGAGFTPNIGGNDLGGGTIADGAGSAHVTVPANNP